MKTSLDPQSSHVFSSSTLPVSGNGGVSRREMLRRAAGAGIGAAAVGTLGGLGGLVPQSLASVVQPGGTDTIKMALIGCGGRGTGAIINAVEADANVEIVALGDVFQSQVDNTAKLLREHRNEDVKLAMKATPETCFAGFDAYRKVCESDADYVLIACPPYFHPAFVTAVVDANKHVFCEKPGAVDGPGLRKLVAAGKKAKEQGTGFLCGLQRRHEPAYIESVKRIEAGEIGKPMHGQGWWNNNGWRSVAREDGWDEMTWQIHNWRQNRWLSGDCPGTLVIHYIDQVNWALGDKPPQTAFGTGGRIANTNPDLFGNIYDHFETHYEYDNDVTVHGMCRTVPGDAPHIAEVVGRDGECNLGNFLIGADGKRIDLRKANEGKPSSLVLEHADMLKSIRDGKPLNEHKYLVDGTLTTMMMRETAYTGKKVGSDFLLNESKRVWGPETEPDQLEFGDHAIQPVAVPGEYELL